MLTTATYFKVYTPVRLQRRQSDFVYIRLTKEMFPVVDTTIEFCIFESVYVSNFSLDWQFWFFELNLAKKSVSHLKHKTSINLGAEFLLKLTFFGTNLHKKSFSNLKQKKWKTPLNCAYSNHSTTMFIIFWNFLMFYQIFPNIPQVKWCTTITYKHGTYQLPHELPKDLRVRILGNWKISEKFLNFMEW